MKMKMSGFRTLFIALVCSRMAPVHALRRNGVGCTADGQCNSNSCYLGQNGDNRSGTCQCRGRCTFSGCAGCPSEQKCYVPSGKLEANTCTNMDGSLVAPKTMRSVSVGEKCIRDDWCTQGVCHKGRYGYDKVGVCECKECNLFWGCGGCDGRSKCLSFGLQINQCVANGKTESPTYFPTAPTSTPTKFPMIDVPIGKNCGLDTHCRNGNCFRGASGKSKLGRCQCTLCSPSGCGGCPKGENCQQIHPMVAHQCMKHDGKPTGVPTPAPTVTPPTTVGLGSECMSHRACASGACYFGKFGIARRGKCECMPCGDSGCGGCQIREVCDSVQNTIGANKCVSDGSTDSPTPSPTNEPTKDPSNVPTDTPTRNPTSTPTRTGKPTKSPVKAPTLIPVKVTCKDAPFYQEPKFGFFCFQISVAGCDSLILFGYSDAEIKEIHDNCALSCNKCAERSAGIITPVPSASPTSCGDTPSFKDSKLGFSCIQFSVVGCDMLLIFGYNVEEIAHVKANCKKSCNICPNNDDLPIVRTTNVRMKIPTDSPTGSPTDSPTGAPVKKQGPALYSVPLGGGCTKNTVCASRSCFRGSCQCKICDTPGCDDGCPLNRAPKYCKLVAYGHTQCRKLDQPTVSPTVPEKSVDLGGPCNEDRVCISNSCHIKPNSAVGTCQCSPCAKTDCRGGCPLRTQFCKFMEPLRFANACVLRTKEPTPTPTTKPSVAKIIIANRSVLVGGICEKDISCRSTSCFIKDNEVFGICQCKHCPFGCRGGCLRADQICRYRPNVAVANVCVTATSKPTISPTVTVTNARTVPLGGKCQKDSWCRSK